MKFKPILLLLSALTLSSAAALSQEKPKDKNLLSKVSEYVSLSAYGQLGYEYDEANDESSLYLRRIIASGKIYPHKKFEMFYMFSMGNGKFSSLELWGKYKVCDAFNVKFGQMKVPFTMESMMSLSKAEIMEGALPVNYLAAIDNSDEVYSGTSQMGGRDLGLQIEGKLINYGYTGDKFLGYQLGIFNGQGINLRDKNKHKDIAGMIDLYPTKWLRLTGGAYFGKGYAMTSMPVSNIKEGQDYTRNRWTTGIEIKTKPFMIRAEYLEGKNGTAIARGAYSTTTIRLYEGLDLISSVSYLKKDKEIDGDICRYIAGAEYRFFNKCRLQFQYQREYDAYLNRPNNQILTQVQIGF